MDEADPEVQEIDKSKEIETAKREFIRLKDAIDVARKALIQRGLQGSITIKVNTVMTTWGISTVVQERDLKDLTPETEKERLQSQNIIGKSLDETLKPIEELFRAFEDCTFPFSIKNSITIGSTSMHLGMVLEIEISGNSILYWRKIRNQAKYAIGSEKKSEENSKGIWSKVKNKAAAVKSNIAVPSMIPSSKIREEIERARSTLISKELHGSVAVGATVFFSSMSVCSRVIEIDIEQYRKSNDSMTNLENNSSRRAHEVFLQALEKVAIPYYDQNYDFFVKGEGSPGILGVGMNYEMEVSSKDLRKWTLRQRALKDKPDAREKVSDFKMRERLFDASNIARNALLQREVEAHLTTAVDLSFQKFSVCTPIDKRQISEFQPQDTPKSNISKLIEKGIETALIGMADSISLFQDVKYEVNSIAGFALKIPLLSVGIEFELQIDWESLRNWRLKTQSSSSN